LTQSGIRIFPTDFAPKVTLDGAVGGSGILMNIVIGIICALIGGFLLSFWFDTAEGGWWFTLFTAILGSVILLWIVGMVQRKT
jgi:uncharacterized membrane protein YeaQ/YmgE (transglycosylase-associated protein family)